MTKEDFLIQAHSKISSDPMSRTTEKVKTALADSSCIFDTHCHIFDRHCISKRYFLLRFFKELIGMESISADEMIFDKEVLRK
jgi:hypothetical protein